VVAVVDAEVTGALQKNLASTLAYWFPSGYIGLLLSSQVTGYFLPKANRLRRSTRERGLLQRATLVGGRGGFKKNYRNTATAKRGLCFL
jgi:hypothetical protein